MVVLSLFLFLIWEKYYIWARVVDLKTCELPCYFFLKHLYGKEKSFHFAA